MAIPRGFDQFTPYTHSLSLVRIWSELVKTEWYSRAGSWFIAIILYQYIENRKATERKRGKQRENCIPEHQSCR